VRFLSREDLGVDGRDSDRISRLAEGMRRSHAQTPSLAYPELPDPRYGPGFTDTIERARSPLPGIARVIRRLARERPAVERSR